jgi:streptomycin 3"-adenylyltransferase
LQELEGSTRHVLGEALVGVYPHGSLVLGGWRADRSDIDVLVVVDRILLPLEQSRLADAWTEDALPCPGVGLELSVVTKETAGSPSARPPFELHVTTAPQDRKVVDGHGHPGELDLVLHFAVCRSLGHPVFAHVPHRLVMAQLADELTWAVEHNPSEYAVLNACRAWRYAVDRSLVSKVDGGRWAAERLDGPELGLVRAALAAQTGAAADSIDPGEAGDGTLRLRDVIRTEA